MGERVIPGRRAGVAARRRRMAIAAGGAALVAAIAIVVTFSPLFGARRVEVEGNVALSSERIMSVAEVGTGTNVVHLDLDAVRARLEDDPWVESATVTRDLPTTIIVRVVERRPVALAAGDVVAADGTVLPGAEPRGLPVIQVVVGAVDRPDIRAGAAAAGALTPSIRRRVGSIVVEPDGDLALDLTEGVTVDYGHPGEDAAKAEALRAVLRWAQEEDIAIEQIDVSVPAAPTARPVGGAFTALP